MIMISEEIHSLHDEQYYSTTINKKKSFLFVSPQINQIPVLFRVYKGKEFKCHIEQITRCAKLIWELGVNWGWKGQTMP